MNIDNNIKKVLAHFDSEDYKTINYILNEVKKYDLYDFIAKISALNLVPENQNKSILLDVIIASLLTVKQSEYISTIKMSSGKFNSIVKKINSMNLRYKLDPPENVFIENVMFYGNYFIFPGINYIPGYSFQQLIDTLFLDENKFKNQFLILAQKFISLILTISNTVAKKLNYSYDNLTNNEKQDILVPDNKKLNFMKELLVIDNEYIKNMFDGFYPIDELYSNFEFGSVESVLNKDEQNFFTKPFLQIDDNKSIILNISILVPFAFHKIICLADKYGEKEKLINKYNQRIWNHCISSLYTLGHNKINEKCLEISSLESNYYKEALFNVCTNKIMIVTYLCDDCENYSKNTIFDRISYDKYNKILNCRLSYIYDNLISHNINKEDIFHIIVVNTFGRELRCGMNKEYFYKPIVLNPYELQCIAINERNSSIFLPRYIKSKNKIITSNEIMFSELNAIEIYTKNHYSFYIDDDFNPKNNVLIIEPGDSVDYKLKAINTEKRHLIESYNEKYLTEVILNDEMRNIYAEVELKPNIALLSKFSNVNIWVYSSKLKSYKEEELDIYFSIIDTISYWLEECHSIIENSNFIFKMIKLELKLINEDEKYYCINNTSLHNYVNLTIKNNTIKILFSSLTLKILNTKDNSFEKKIIKDILYMLNKLTKEKNINIKELDIIFKNQYKKKLLTFDYENNPCIKPLRNGAFTKIKAEDENELLDNIGSSILDSGQWTYGVIKNEERSNIAHYIVDYLYELLQKQISELSEEGLCELICYNLEITMYNLSIFQNKYSYDIACYPEKSDKLLNDFNELNKTSCSLKFLAEYVAACPPNGNKVIDEWQYEKLLAICNLIIQWAYNNDLFYYNIFNTQVEILNSGRVGMNQEEFNKLYTINNEIKKAQLSFYSLGEFNKKANKESFPNFYKELNVAFLDEYNFSLDEFSSVISEMIVYGDSTECEVNVVNKLELINYIVNNKNLDRNTVNRVLEYISLTKRENFLKPPKPYRKEDVYPWRFNRELSFTRRPVIIRGNEIIWGNRQLYQMFIFTLNLIYEGKLKTRKSKFTTLLGEISKKRGEDFNNQVYYKIKEIDTFIVDKNLKKINHKSITDDNGNTLGDIDILYIVPNRNLIVLAEVKDFNCSKNPYEMNLEYEKMFVDKEKKSFATKHKNRALWVKEHLEDVKKQYKLSGDKWIVKYIFIVNEAMVSNTFYKMGYTIITYDKITRKVLENV